MEKEERGDLERERAWREEGERGERDERGKERKGQRGGGDVEKRRME